MQVQVRDNGLRNGDNDVGKDNEVDGESEIDESYVAVESESDKSDVEFEPIDSEEERDLELDDGFEEEMVKRKETKGRRKGKQKKLKTKFAKRARPSGHKADGRGCEVEGFIPANVDSMHAIDDAYSSDEYHILMERTYQNT